jgi:Recombination endonuclease VII
MKGKKTEVVDGQKVCSHCNTPKPIEQFIRHKKLTASKEYRDSRCDLCRRKYHQMRRYGLSEDQYSILTAAARCSVCGEDGSDYQKGLHVDHCHDTHVVRGMLCQRCNFLAGFVKDTGIELVAAVQEYLAGKHLKLIPENERHWN